MAETFQAFVRLRSKGANGAWLVPPELRPMLVASAREQDSNLTSVAIEILSRRYGVPFEPSGRKTTPDKDGEELNLSLPLPLAQAIGAAANARIPRLSMQDEIRRALCAEFGLAFSKPQRARRPRSRAAA